MGRVINPKVHLRDLLKDEQRYHIGFGVKNLTTEGVNYRDLNELIKGNIKDLLVRGAKGVLKENIHGKFVRKQPERKVEVEKHIKYTRKDGTKVEYDRKFIVWEKEHIPGYKLELYKSISPQNEVVLHFPKFVMAISDDSYSKEKLAMNIGFALGGYYQLYNESFEPIIRTTATLDRKILEKGVGNVRDKLQNIRERLSDGSYEKDGEGNSYRFAMLQDFNITDVYDGIGGFNEYFQFEYADDDIVILENLRTGNATYIFRLSKFDKDRAFDKQTARGHRSFLERVVHNNVIEWEAVLSRYLKKNK